MRKLIQPLLLLVAFCTIFSSCVSKKKFNELLNNKATSDLSLAENQAKVAELQKDLTALNEEKDQLNQKLENETTRLNDEVASVKDDLMKSKEAVTEMEQTVAAKDSTIAMMQEKVNSTFEVYTKGGFDVTNRNSGLFVNTPSPIRFRSGSTRISQDSKTALTDLANKLMQSPTVKILVEGHTDNVPMKEGARFKNNEELSVARANRVVKELVKLGVNPLQLAATGFGFSRPLVHDESDSAEARATNRRTEFVIMANVGNLYDLSKGM